MDEADFCAAAVEMRKQGVKQVVADVSTRGIGDVRRDACVLKSICELADGEG